MILWPAHLAGLLFCSKLKNIFANCSDIAICIVTTTNN